MAEFLRREWFSRAWTFQEIVLACHPVVVCGSNVLEWNAFLRGFGSLNILLRFPEPTALSARSMRVVHYGRLRFSRTMEPGTYQRTLSVSRSLFDDFQAFERVLELWKRIERLEPKSPGELRKKSFYDLQKPYVDIHNLLLPGSERSKSLISWVSTSMTWVVNLLDRLLRIECIGDNIDIAPDQTADILIKVIALTLRRRSAKEARDRALALYGVLESFDRRLPPPDYGESLGKFYHVLLSHLLASNPSAVAMILDAGRSPGARDNMTDAPSWVPDWSNISPEPTISANIFQHDAREFDATPGLPPYAQVGEDPYKLNVRGHLSGYITFCTNPFREIDYAGLDLPGDETITSFQSTVGEFARLTSAIFNNSRTPLPKKTPPGLRKAPYGRRESRDYSKPVSCAEARPTNLYFILTRKIAEEECQVRLVKVIYAIFTKNLEAYARLSLRKRAITIVRDLYQSKVLGDFVDIINDLARNGRQLFLTSGGYLGCSSQDLVARKDRLALVVGVPAPLVLRPCNAHTPHWFDTEYEVASSAFVPGWTEGEAFREDKVEEIKPV
ncbi:Fc.00g017080.m01.CDS01 [Cosmosporella sp. VM-42]